MLARNHRAVAYSRGCSLCLRLGRRHWAPGLLSCRRRRGLLLRLVHPLLCGSMSLSLGSSLCLLERHVLIELRRDCPRCRSLSVCCCPGGSGSGGLPTLLSNEIGDGLLGDRRDCLVRLLCLLRRWRRLGRTLLHRLWHLLARMCLTLRRGDH